MALKNAALFAVQILSVKYPELVTKLAENRLQMQEEVKAKGEKLAKMRAEVSKKWLKKEN